MAIILLILLTATLAWAYAKYPEKFNFSFADHKTVVEILRWIFVILAWNEIGGILNGIAVFLLAQSAYNPVYNYFSGKDAWFIEDDTWYGRLAIKYLGEGSGRVLFYGQLAIGLLILLI